MGGAATADQGQYLTFCIADEEYAVRILRIKEIMQFESVTKVPTTPPWIRGVMNLRGSVVPVVDLAVKFGLRESPIGKTTCIVIVETELAGQPALMGVMTDSVNQVVDLSSQDIEAPPAFGTRVRVHYLLGMAKIGTRFALILDIDRVLSTDELLAAMSAGEQSREPPAAADAPTETVADLHPASPAGLQPETSEPTHKRGRRRRRGGVAAGGG